MNEVSKEVIHILSIWIPYLLPALIALLLLVALGWIIYDLINAGKSGLGWASLVVVAGASALVLRLAIAVFREVAGGASSSDWDG